MILLRGTPAILTRIHGHILSQRNETPSPVLMMLYFPGVELGRKRFQCRSIMTETASGHLIELRVNQIAQLFHTLDPFPFRERDLDIERRKSSSSAGPANCPPMVR